MAVQAQIAVSLKVQQEIRERVESGKYPDADAVIEAALEQLEDYEKLIHVRVVLKASHDDIANGLARAYTPELRDEIWRAAMKRAAAGEKPNPDVCG